MTEAEQKIHPSRSGCHQKREASRLPTSIVRRLVYNQRERLLAHKAASSFSRGASPNTLVFMLEHLVFPRVMPFAISKAGQTALIKSGRLFKTGKGALYCASCHADIAFFGSLLEIILCRDRQLKNRRLSLELDPAIAQMNGSIPLYSAVGCAI